MEKIFFQLKEKIKEILAMHTRVLDLVLTEFIEGLMATTCRSLGNLPPINSFDIKMTFGRGQEGVGGGNEEKKEKYYTALTIKRVLRGGSPS